MNITIGTQETACLPAQHAAPVGNEERIASIDVLRGFALLGILVMNMPWFSLPSASFFNPLLAGGFDGADYWTWLISHLLFDMKMITIFSMLFGAGILIFTQRASARSGGSVGVYYRRMLWMLLFGLVHGYLIWSGDILYTYAMCGFWVYWLRRLPWVWLLFIGFILMCVGAATNVGGGFFFAKSRDAAHLVTEMQAAGSQPNADQVAMSDLWQQMNPGPAQLEEEAAAFRGSYLHLIRHQAPWVFWFQTFMFLALMVWRTGGVMLIGMALMKLRVFDATRPVPVYLAMSLIGYGTGVPLAYYGAQTNIDHCFDLVYLFKAGLHYNYFGSILVALGHIGLVMLVCKSDTLQLLLHALGAVGQMAFTNYIMHSVICTLLFNGYGLGLWNTLSRVETLWIIGGIWALQFIISPLWLRYFRFGPLEWLWRSLTYWKRQPMRRAKR